MQIPDPVPPTSDDNEKPKSCERKPWMAPELRVIPIGNTEGGNFTNEVESLGNGGLWEKS